MTIFNVLFYGNNLKATIYHLFWPKLEKQQRSDASLSDRLAFLGIMGTHIRAPLKSLEPASTRPPLFRETRNVLLCIYLSLCQSFASMLHLDLLLNFSDWLCKYDEHKQCYNVTFQCVACGTKAPWYKSTINSGPEWKIKPKRSDVRLSERLGSLGIMRVPYGAIEGFKGPSIGLHLLLKDDYLTDERCKLFQFGLWVWIRIRVVNFYN